MQKLPYTILKNYRLGLRTQLKNSTLDFERIHYLKYAEETGTKSWTRTASSLADLIRFNRPLSYVIKSLPFLNCNISILNNLLVPRPETEEFVHALIKRIADIRTNSRERLRILDIGCGTGCISVALAANLKCVDVTSIDINAKACICTKKNFINNQDAILKNNSSVNVIRVDIFDDVSLGKFDLIVSNPPYIPSWKRKQVQPSVLLHEDRNALFPRSNEFNGLQFHKRILELSKILLVDRPSSKIPKVVLEFDGAYQVPTLKRLLKENSLDHFYLRRDSFNRYRTLWIH